MTIRIPNPMSSPMMQLNLLRAKSQYNNYSEQISSGNAIVNVGDNPSGSAMILDFQTSINQNNQYLNSVNTAASYLSSTETAVTALGNDVTGLMQLAQEAMSGTQSTSTLTDIANQVTSKFNDMVNLGNTQVEGNYIFAGTNTTTKPFDPTTAPAGQPNSITYNGNNATINVGVGVAITTPTNFPGDTLFLGGAAPGSYGSSSDIFNQAQSLSQAMTNPALTSAQRTTAITNIYNNLQTISDNVNQNIATLGGWESGVNNQKNNLTSVTANLQAVQSSIQGVNYDTAITGLDQASISQQATLAAMSKMANQQNLFNFLG